MRSASPPSAPARSPTSSVPSPEPRSERTPRSSRCPSPRVCSRRCSSWLARRSFIGLDNPRSAMAFGGLMHRERGCGRTRRNRPEAGAVWRPHRDLPHRHRLPGRAVPALPGGSCHGRVTSRTSMARCRQCGSGRKVCERHSRAGCAQRAGRTGPELTRHHTLRSKQRALDVEQSHW